MSAFSLRVRTKTSYTYQSSFTYSYSSQSSLEFADDQHHHHHSQIHHSPANISGHAHKYRQKSSSSRSRDLGLPPLKPYSSIMSKSSDKIPSDPRPLVDAGKPSTTAPSVPPSDPKAADKLPSDIKDTSSAKSQLDIPSGETLKDSGPPLPSSTSRRSRLASKGGSDQPHRPNLPDTTSYPRPIFTLIQSMLPRMGLELGYTGEPELFMLWNAILNAHFPAEMGYGISFHKSDKPEDATNFLTVKLIQVRSESTVLVLGFKKPGDDTTKGREAVEKATADHVIGPGFDETDFDEIYTINSVGLSWASSKLEEPKTESYKSGEAQPERIVDWTTNMTSALSFDKMRMIASKINSLTQKNAEAALGSS
ncbi:hypothetical protein BKA70DRAFT_39822 [Coprinopsis sp. MPI-PUGE-AT-0042]|nr:hypothetical protein BKA70DRAFT_39822 [Coprinopsis sp. MPI-PUGE-AT-0042]